MKKAYPVINKLECKACERCIIACPRNVLYMSSRINERGYHYVEYRGEGCNAGTATTPALRSMQSRSI